jgi:hypothetical protein
LLFGHKNKLQVDLGDLHSEKENLSSFLNSNLKVGVSSNLNKLSIDSEVLSPQDLQKAVTKFVYHKNLNTTHYASLDGSVVRISEFQTNGKKPEKRNKNATPPHMAHGF